MTMKQKKARGTRAQSIGQKRPFTQEQVQLIRANLLAQKPGIGNTMQLALLETSISTCLRCGDLLLLKAGDVIGLPGSYDKVPIKQQKTGDVVLVRINERARAGLAAWIKLANLGPGDRLFRFTSQYYRRLVKGWARLAHLDPRHYSTHSMRRTHPAHLYHRTKNVKAAQMLLGHSSIAHTGAYLGVDQDAAHDLAKEHDV